MVAKNNADFQVLEKTEYAYSEIPVAKLRRYFSWKNFLDIFVFCANIFRGLSIVHREKPDFIFSKGGFVSLPLGLAAWTMNVPFYLHETDSAMGFSNRILSRFAQKIFTGFPSKNSSHIFVGNPVREEFFLSPQKKEALKISSQEEKKRQKIFIFGGSQGAQAINKWARHFFTPAYINTHSLEVLLITGRGKRDTAVFSESNHSPYFVEQEFLYDDFVQKVHDADIVITRAGGSISELSAAQKPAILIPLPSAANNHQLKNAQIFLKKNAALLIEEKNLYTNETTFCIENLLRNSQQKKILSENISLFSCENVPEKIWDEIEKKA